MKKFSIIIFAAILMVFAAMLTGCGEVKFPDLSDYGIKESDFRRDDEPYHLSDVHDADEAMQFISYTNDNGDRMVFTPKGNFYSYSRKNSFTSEKKFTLSAGEYDKITYGAMKKIIPNIKKYNKVGTTDVTFEKRKNPKIIERAKIMLDGDGSIIYIKVDNSVELSDKEVEKLKNKAQKQAEERWKNMSGFNYVTINYDCGFFKIDGINCGIFNYTISEGDPEAFGCYDILVCDK